MVPEVYDSLFFPSYLSFPLEGNSRAAGKGVRGRAPIGCSIAVLTANRRPLANSWPSPPCKQAAQVLISAVVKVFYKRAPSINLEAPTTTLSGIAAVKL